ncbi:uncharacterized protein LOC128952020 [Oppia nitens]|uniref:uncharacterized protein LOC128952020 n=1 Tax=Oppia nitens TaxID=1686743 RepID=UPI0023DA3A78|nr:uncharacterized protein LOC128952020 [Oppia nitens]
MDSDDDSVDGDTTYKRNVVMGVLIGDELGHLKRIDMAAKDKVLAIHSEPVDDIHHSKSVSSITCLHNNNNDNHCSDYLIANKCHSLSIYNSVSNHLHRFRVGVNNESFLMGAQPIDDNNIVVCYENGSVFIRNIEKELIQLSENKKKAIKLLGLDLISTTTSKPDDSVEKRKISKSVQCSNGKDVLTPKSTKPCTKPSKYVNTESSVITSCTPIFNPNYNTANTHLTSFKVNDHMLAIGGKNIDLKVFDLNTKQSIFNAKPLSNDWLGIKQETWISGVEWVGGNSKSNECPSWVATCSRSDSVVRVYDIKSKQKKPVMNINLKNETFNNDSNPPSFTAICSTSVPHTIAKPTQNIILGTTIGRMMAVDLRFNTHSYRHLGVFKGFGGGAIRDVKYVGQTHNTFKVLSCSLDRFVRIHNFKTCPSSTRSLESKIYIKTRPTCLQPICNTFKTNSLVMDIDDDIDDSDID